MAEQRFVWLDLETTGLDPYTKKIIQLGMIVTDANLKEIARFEEVVRCTDERGIWDQPAWEMHSAYKTGLQKKAEQAEFTLNEVEVLARKFIKDQGGEKPIMAGNSIHFDRSFLAERMPDFLALFHYRMLDVSFFKVLQDAWGLTNAAPSSSKPAHTAIADLENAIASFKNWKTALFRPGIGPEL